MTTALPVPFVTNSSSLLTYSHHSDLGPDQPDQRQGSLVGMQVRHHGQWVLLSPRLASPPLASHSSAHPDRLSFVCSAVRKNPTDPSKKLQTGGSVINTASFVALMGAATPQIACQSPSRISSLHRLRHDMC